MTNYREIAWQGLWKNNPGLVQLLGLCPLLAVTATITNALGLGLATMLVLIGSNILVSLVRDYVPKEIRIPVFVMIIAALVTTVQLLINAYACRDRKCTYIVLDTTFFRCQKIRQSCIWSARWFLCLLTQRM